MSERERKIALSAFALGLNVGLLVMGLTWIANVAFR